MLIMALIDLHIMDYVEYYGKPPILIHITKQEFEELTKEIEQTYLIKINDYIWKPKFEGHLADYNCIPIRLINNLEEHFVGVS